MALIKLENISKYYKSGDGVSVGMQKVSLDFHLNEFVAITGESGSGKSTLLNVISGLDTYEDGELYIHNEETSHFLVKDWENYRSKYIGFIFQSYNIIDSFTVYENVVLALEVQNYPRKLRKKRALELIEKVGLTSHKNHKASKLSGGQKQRTVIARALAKDTPIIVADEPTGNLDSESSKQIIHLLQELSKDKLIIMVTHDYEQIKSIATRHIKMHDGEVVEDKKLRTVDLTTEVTEPDIKAMSIASVARFALRNLLSRPRLLVFFVALQIMIILVFTMTYSNFMNTARSDIFNLDSGPGWIQDTYFDFYTANISDNRLNVVRKDGQPMTNADYIYLENLSGGSHELYRGALSLDLNASESVRYTHREGYNVWLDSSRVKFDSNIHIAQQPQFRLDGRITGLAQNEVVISNALQANVGDILTINEFVSFEGIITAQLYDPIENVYLIPENILSNANIQDLQWQVVYDDLTVDQFDHKWFDFPLNQFVDEERIDDVLRVEIDIRYQTYEEVEYLIAGIFNDNSRSIIYFPHEHITLTGDQTASLVASSQVAAERLFNAINRSTYRVIYPSQQQDQISRLFAPLNFIVSLFFYVIIYLFAIFLYFILFSVMKNVMSSRKKDFAIFRSIGTNESKLGMLVIFEQIYMMIISFMISMIVINVLSYSNYTMYLILQRLLPVDYVVLFLTFTYLSVWLARRFNKKTFKISVIENLTESREDTL